VARIVEGIRVVMADQILVGSMAIDLFAVFFGGATALLPIFATDILHVGPTGFGVLRAAMSVGSLLAMLVAVRHPPRARAGLALHLAVAGFGIAIITFALSRNYLLSVFALCMAGAADGVSMVVRQAILRLVAPGPMRGRISAVRSVFISSSNELGEFESGVLAKLVGGRRDHTRRGGDHRLVRTTSAPTGSGGVGAARGRVGENRSVSRHVALG
jgi:MFS family permease